MITDRYTGDNNNSYSGRIADLDTGDNNNNSYSGGNYDRDIIPTAINNHNGINEVYRIWFYCLRILLLNLLRSRIKSELF